jgi:hypothetical protein
LLYNAIGKVNENQGGLELNGTHILLAHGDDVNLLSENINTIQKNIEPLLNTSNEAGLEANVGKIAWIK